MTRERVTEKTLDGKRRTRTVGSRLPDPFRRWTAEDVIEAQDPLVFAAYCQQTIGIPWPNIENERILRKKIKEFFGRYPRADYGTLVKLARFCRDKKYRPEQCWKVFLKFEQAWKAGVLPELDPDAPHPVLEEQIRLALEEESDKTWRRKLIMARGENQQRKVLQEWMNRPRPTQSSSS